MDTAELAAWLRLTATPGVGRSAARRLLRAFGTAEGAMAASFGAQREAVGEAAALALVAAGRPGDELLGATLEWLAGPGDGLRTLIPLGDPRYPAALLETPDPPLLLYAQGRVELLSGRSVAVVGSRHPTPQGAANARQFAGALSQSAWTVVSGLALGIDGAAHEGALAQPSSTIAVVGTGLDLVYPRRHAALAASIGRAGVLVSEYPLGTPALAPHFPQRNRIIAGLSRGTLVVEAAPASGSLITARLAADSGREVFAIPGSIHSPLSRGCHQLLKQGAKLVEDVADILDELGAWGAPPAKPASPGRRPASLPTDPLLDALGFDPVSLDTLLARTGGSASDLAARLLALELEGRVARLPGPAFQRIAPG